jgi:hypothetical protein
MKRESQFFVALTVSDSYWQRVNNPETRMGAVQQGYMGQDFGVEEIDKKILPQISNATTPSEFAQQYLALKNQNS